MEGSNKKKLIVLQKCSGFVKISIVKIVMDIVYSFKIILKNNYFIKDVKFMNTNLALRFILTIQNIKGETLTTTM